MRSTAYTVDIGVISSSTSTEYNNKEQQGFNYIETEWKNEKDVLVDTTVTQLN